MKKALLLSSLFAFYAPAQSIADNTTVKIFQDTSRPSIDTYKEKLGDNSTIQTEYLSVSVSGFLNEKTVADIITELDQLRKTYPDKTLTLAFGDIKGGTVDDGFNLAHFFGDIGDINLLCQGDIQSMGATLFASHHYGDRIIGSDCRQLMTHDLIYHVPKTSITSNRFIRADMNARNESYNMAYEMMVTATANVSGMSYSAAEALFGVDCTLNPDQAYQLGLADYFEDESNTAPERLLNQTAEDIYRICDTKPIDNYFSYPRWDEFNFNGVTLTDISSARKSPRP